MVWLLVALGLAWPCAAAAAQDPPTPASAQSLSAGSVEHPAPPAWSFGLSGALYLLPGEDDFVQPTLKADHGRLHLETRYNYEDRESTSFFAGASFELGSRVKLALTPMIGGLVGQTDGVVPALEAELTAGRVSAWAEAEYVFDLGDSSSRFFYMWSELSFWPAEWLRVGLVTQRTRVYQTERDLQRGLLVGVAWKQLEGAAYFFNPGADDHFTVVSLGLSF
jgi:hypothetical protein